MFNTQILLLDLISQYNSKIRPIEDGDQTPELLKLIMDFDQKIRIAISSESSEDANPNIEQEMLANENFNAN